MTVDGRRAVCERNDDPAGRAGREGRVTAFVDRDTSVPTPRVFWVGADAFLTAWDENAPTPGSGEPNEAWARAAGRGLAWLHAETAEAVDGYGEFVVRDADAPVTAVGSGVSHDESTEPDDESTETHPATAEIHDLAAVGLATTGVSTARE